MAHFTAETAKLLAENAAYTLRKTSRSLRLKSILYKVY